MDKWVRRVVLTIPLTALVAVSACGGASTSSGTPSSSSGSGLAAAKQAIQKAREQPPFVDPGPAFNTSGARGKTIYLLPQVLQVPFDKAWTDATTAALAKVGAKTVVNQTNADPSAASRLMQQAIGAHADLIVVEGIPTASLTQPLQAAKAAKIPVVKLFDGDPQLPPDQSFAAEVTYCYSCGARLEADWTAMTSNGNVNAIVYWNTGIASGPILNQALTSEYNKVCPSTCHADFKEGDVTQWSTQLPTNTSADLLHNPPYNYWIPSYDSMLTFIVPSLRNASHPATGVSFNSDLPIMQMLQKKDGVSALVGSPVEWMGWAIADQGLRVLTGQSPVADENVPLRVFDSTNIGNVDLTKSESAWYGTDFISKYIKLWGVS